MTEVQVYWLFAEILARQLEEVHERNRELMGMLRQALGVSKSWQELYENCKRELAAERSKRR